MGESSRRVRKEREIKVINAVLNYDVERLDRDTERSIDIRPTTRLVSIFGLSDSVEVG